MSRWDKIFTKIKTDTSIFVWRWKNDLEKPLFYGVRALALLSSLLVIIGIIYQVGFLVSPGEYRALNQFYRVIRYIYLIYIALVLISDRKVPTVKYKLSFWLLSVVLYITTFSEWFSFPFEHNLSHSYFNLLVLLLFSLLMLSHGVIRIMGKQTNPSFIIAVSFLLIIIGGSFLLQMPKCTFAQNISWIDSLFISTSAVCVTGLTSVDVPATFTLTGMAVILLLVQIGGLGVMTLTSFFALFFMGNTSIYNQLVIRDVISSNSLGNSLKKTLLYVFFFTLIIEFFVAIFI